MIDCVIPKRYITVSKSMFRQDGTNLSDLESESYRSLFGRALPGAEGVAVSYSRNRSALRPSLSGFRALETTGLRAACQTSSQTPLGQQGDG